MDLKYVQYVILPKELGMSTGKASSQACHATYMALQNQKKKMFENGNDYADIFEWEKSGMPVIVLGCYSVGQLFGLKAYCEEWDIPHHMYVDEGITETEPMLPTAFATGIIDKETTGLFFQKFELYSEGRWQTLKRLI